MTPDQLALLGDERLSAEARSIGAVVSLAGETGVTYADLEAFFPRSSRERLRRAIQLLERTKWVHRETGGRGHSDRFTLLEWAESATYSSFRVAILDNLKNRVPETRTLNGYRVGKSPGSKAPTTTTTELLPLPQRANEEAKRFVEDTDALVGCRGALCDYLTARVDSGRQLAYAQSVAGIIEGTDESVWMTYGGSRIHEDRPQIIAGCLNELRAGDEVGKYFPGAPGNIANLRSKIRYKVKSLAAAESEESPVEKRKAAEGWLYDDGDAA